LDEKEIIINQEEAVQDSCQPTSQNLKFCSSSLFVAQDAAEPMKDPSSRSLPTASIEFKPGNDLDKNLLPLFD